MVLKLLPPVLTVSILAGCRPSDEAKAAAAVARLQNRPTPGFVRIVNLTGGTVGVLKNGRPLTADVVDEASSRLVPLGVGASELKVGSQDIHVDLTSGEGTSVVVYPSQKPEQIKGEIRKPDTSKNVAVYFVAGDGSASLPAKGVMVRGGSSPVITSGTKSLSLPPGDYDVQGTKIKIEEKLAYTFLFVPFKKQFRVFLMLNTPNEKVMGASAASA